MTIIEILQGLIAEDGLNIPMSTLAIYCGIPKQTMGAYIRGECNPSKEREDQIRRGLQEYLEEY